KGSPVKKFFKRFLLWSGLLLGFVLLLLVLIAALFEQQIGEKVIQEVNKQLKTELKVEEVSLSLLSGFPKASVNLDKVLLEDALQGNLLEADRLALRFGLLSLFGSEIQLHEALIEDGALMIHISRKGLANYNIIKKSEEGVQKASVKEKELSLSLEKARLSNVELIYLDEQADFAFRAKVQEADLSGAFSGSAFRLSCFADMRSNFLDIDKYRYIVGKNLVLNAELDVDLEENRYTMKDVDLAIESDVFQVDGTIEAGKKATVLDLAVTAKDGSLESVIDLLPEEQLAYFSDFKSTGTFFFDASIKGKLSSRTTPKILVNFGLEDGRISSTRLDDPLKEVNFKASFTNGTQQSNLTSVFEIKDFKGYFNRELIESRLQISNFAAPKIAFTVDGVLPMGAVYGLFDHPAITDGSGEVEVKRFSLKGRLKDMQTPSRIGRVRSSGTLEFDDASLTINKEEMVVDKGEIVVKNNSLLVNDVKLEGAGSEINLNGKFLNLLPVLFADSLNSRKAELRFQASLDAPNVDFDRLIALTKIPIDEDLTPKGEVDSLKVAQTLQRERITNFLKGTFQAKIDAYNYRQIEGKDFSGSFEFDNNELSIKGRTQAMEGSFNVDGQAFFEDRPYLKAKLDCEDINVKEFFRQGENFGQEVVQHQHIDGTLKAQLAIDAFWDEEGYFKEDKLHILGDISIDDGELKNFKLLYDFSDYIKLKDLKHIKFVNMRNWMEIKKGKIYLPAMFLQSNALNLTLSGEHSFDNDINYNIKLNAGQVLWNKFKRYNPRLKPQASKKKGWFNIYYRVFGTVDKYQIKSDKRGVKRNFERSDRKKRSIQDQLVRVFGEKIDLSDEPSDWKDDIPEYGGEDPDDVEFLDDLDTGGEEDIDYLDEEVIISDPDEEVEAEDDVEYIDWGDDGY
ncbi:MAG: AsmA-like C-terminal region-containing protein, partial [Bacteroidota bacterium]